MHCHNYITNSVKTTSLVPKEKWSVLFGVWMKYGVIETSMYLLEKHSTRLKEKSS